MQHSNVGGVSSSPSVRRPVSLADYAAFDEESLLRYFMDDTGKSREQLTQEMTEQWGGIDKFLDFCRKEKETNEKYMRGEGHVPVFRLGRKPYANEKVETVPLTDDVSIRIYGADLAQTYSFYFDFFHKHNGAIKKPSGIRIYAQDDVEVFSIFESLGQSSQGAQWGTQLDADDSDAHTFIIPEGTVLRIVIPNKQPCFLRMPVRGQELTFHAI